MIFEFVNGARLLAWRGRSSSTAAWYVGLPDYTEMMFISHLLRPGDLFLDGGANVGVWSVLAASTGASVLAVEPIEETAWLLQQQGDLNQLGSRLRIFRCALSDSTGSVSMTTGGDVGNLIVPADHPGQSRATVNSTKIDEIFVQAGGVPTAIKLDLEGHEYAALRGGRKVLADPSLLALVIETFRPHNWRSDQFCEMERFLEGFGFLPHEYHPDERALAPLLAPDAGGQNTIYVRDLEPVTARLRGNFDPGGGK